MPGGVAAYLQVSVVFMTDGADTASKNLGLSMQLFQAFLNSCQVCAGPSL